MTTGSVTAPPPCLRPLRYRKRQLQRLPGPPDGECGRGADAVGAERAQQRLDAPDRAAVPGRDHVALADAGRGAGSTGVHAHHHRTGAAAVERDRLQAQPKVAAGDAAMRLKPRRDPLDRDGRDDEDAPPRPEHRHAKDMPGGVQDGSTLGLAPQRHVELDARADVAATHAAPGPAHERDRAEGRHRRTVPQAPSTWLLTGLRDAAEPGGRAG